MVCFRRKAGQQASQQAVTQGVAVKSEQKGRKLLRTVAEVIYHIVPTSDLRLVDLSLNRDRQSFQLLKTLLVGVIEVWPAMHEDKYMHDFLSPMKQLKGSTHR